MLKRFFQVSIVVFVLCSTVSAFASEIKELKRMGPATWAATRSGDGAHADRLLCIDGLKVFQTIAFGAGNGSGATVSNIQLYEEKNGKVVPVRCQ